jgi:hypothetical protein
MEKPKILSLGERRRDKENEGKRTALEVSPDNNFLYPEEKVEITVDEALELANEAIEKYSDPEKLFEDFARRERVNIYRQDYKELDDDQLKKEIETDRETQRSFARLSTTKSLLRIFDLHRKNPQHYYKIMLLACAEELKRRLGPSPT